MATEATGRDTPGGTPSSPAAIEQEIDVRRARLAATIDELSSRAHPREIARRGVAGVSAKARGAVETPEGHLRTERVGAVAAAAVVLLVALVWIRRRT